MGVIKCSCGNYECITVYGCVLSDNGLGVMVVVHSCTRCATYSTGRGASNMCESGIRICGSVVSRHSPSLEDVVVQPTIRKLRVGWSGKLPKLGLW